MPKRKDTSATDFEKLQPGLKRGDLPKTPAVDATLHQDLTLSKGERDKGPSPAYAIGKKVEQKERMEDDRRKRER